MEIKHFSRTTVTLTPKDVKELIRKHLEVDNGFNIVGDFNFICVPDNYGDYEYILGDVVVEISTIHPNG